MADNQAIEERLNRAIAEIERALDGDPQMRWQITRALVHRAVHYAVEQPGVEFCALATYLAEMVGHAHRLAHGDNPRAPTHKDQVH
jgi:hypothetical protein